MKQKRYRMNEPDGDSPWKLLVIFALLCLGVSAWLSVRSDSWSPRQFWSHVQEKLDSPEVRAELRQVEAKEEADYDKAKQGYLKQVADLNKQIDALKRENEAMRARLDKRAAKTP